jgi:type I restriction enzyme M protein
VRWWNKNKLSDDNIKNILESFKKRENKEYFSKLVENNQIAENNYNIAVSSYVEQEDTREKIDIKELNKKIAEIVKKEDELRKAIDEIVTDLEGIE